MGNCTSRRRVKELERERFHLILVGVCERHRLERVYWEEEKLKLMEEIEFLKDRQQHLYPVL